VDRYDLVVLGAGATGLGAAMGAARAGRRVALLDGRPPGGDCTYFGCVPSKALLETARRVQAARTGPSYGFTAAVDVDMAAVTARVKAVIGEIARDESPAVLERLGVTFVGQRGRFTAPATVETEDGTGLRATAVVVATGGSAAVPPVPGLESVPYLTNRTVFDLTELPGHLVVLGGGPVACELAQAFRRLGSAVTVVEAAARLLGRDEPEASAVLLEVLRREGVTVRLGMSAVGAAVAAAGPALDLADGTRVTGTHLLVATGRRPDTGGLGLAAAGVAVDGGNGRIVVDAALRTTARGVWAAGDCASPYQFTHTGDEQGRLAAANAFARRPKPFDTRVIPWVTFTEPEVGHVGLTEAEAYERYGGDARVTYVPFTSSDRARCAGETDGFVKLIGVPRGPGPLRSRYLYGVGGFTAVCPVGGELVAEMALAMKTRMLAARLATTIHAYPTWGITSRLAAAQLFGEYGGRSSRPAAPATPPPPSPPSPPLGRPPRDPSGPRPPSP